MNWFWNRCNRATVDGGGQHSCPCRRVLSGTLQGNALLTAPGVTMSRTRLRSQFAAVRSPGALAWVPRLVHALALIGLCLLPMQMRAGTAHPHPHALLQLVLDARNGSFDHHALGDEPPATTHAHTETSNGTDRSHPDIPTFGDSMVAGGGLAMLIAILTTVVLAPPGAMRIWPRPLQWRGRLPALDPPPPRLGCP